MSVTHCYSKKVEIPLRFVLSIEMNLVLVGDRARFVNILCRIVTRNQLEE